MEPTHDPVAEVPAAGGGDPSFSNDLPLDGETCDSCRADDVPLARITLRSGGQLVFCGTCWNIHESVLREQAATVRG